MRHVRSRITAAAVPLAIVLLVGGCRSTAAPPKTEPRPPASQAPELPADIHWVRNSAEYRAAVLQVYRSATARLERLAEGREAGTWAVVSDADETILDNSQYQKERAEQGLGFTPESWADWVRRREAPPIPGAVEFLRSVRALGGRIAIVTNRSEPLCPASEDNFRSFEVPFDVMLCRPEASGDKNPRFSTVSEGRASADLPPLEIVMWLGDNIHDFPKLGQDVRHQPDSAFTDFGTRYFVFPNPMYGSWTRNTKE